MPDEPNEGAAMPEKDPKELLREKLERIEREEASKGPDLPALPSNDEIRAGTPMSPIESQINGAQFGLSETQEPQKELSDEEQKLKEFDERLKAVRANAMPEPPEWNYQRPKIPGQNDHKDQVAYVGLGVGISVGYTMIGCVVAGWGIGKLIDMKTGGMTGQGFGTMIGALIGLAGGVFMIIRAQSKNPNS